MEKGIGLLALMIMLTNGMPANKDSLSCMVLSGKLSRKGVAECKAYRVELRSGKELIRTIYSATDEDFTLLLKRNRQNALKVIANETELKQVFIRTHHPFEKINEAHYFNPKLNIPENKCERKEAGETAGTVNFDPGTRSFHECRNIRREEEGSDIKPK